MKKTSAPTIFICNFFCASAQDDQRRWYQQPAANWNKALPFGNGRQKIFHSEGIIKMVLKQCFNLIIEQVNVMCRNFWSN